MSAVGVKWAVRRYQPALTGVLGGSDGASMEPRGQDQIFDDWKDVVKAADTIVGTNDLNTGALPNDPVVIKSGEDVVLIYMKLDI